ADLEPTPLFTGQICDDCLQCVKECEANAIGKNRDIELKIEGNVYSHARPDTKACGEVHRGDNPRFSPFWNGSEEPGEKPSYNKFSQHRFRHLAICVGRGCLRSCLDHLEKNDIIKKQFKTPFIERERWKLNQPPQKDDRE
ncbi:MAG: hypothetical protein ACOC1S_02705, partial [bacterium]